MEKLHKHVFGDKKNATLNVQTCMYDFVKGAGLISFYVYVQLCLSFLLSRYILNTS